MGTSNMLTSEQKRERIIISEANLAVFNSNPKTFLRRFVRVDETWVHCFDPEFKVQSKECRRRGSPPPRHFRVQPSAGKINWFHGILFHQDNPQVHKSLVVSNAIHNVSFKLMVQPHHTPDLAPSDL